MKNIIRQRRGKEKILVFDSSQQAAIMLYGIFSAVEYDIFYTPNKSAAFEIFNRIRPGMIILNFENQLADELEFLKLLKPGPEDPYDIIAIAPAEDEEIITKCYELGVRNFLKKPFNHIQLRETVRRSISMKKLEEDAKISQCILEKKVREKTAKLLKSRKDAQTATMLLETALDEINSANVKLEAMAVKVDIANKAKAEFFINMNHEIRTPLGGILGIAELLEKTKLDKLQREYVDDIISSGTLLRQIVTDILDFSKIESGNIELETIPVNIKQIMKELCNVISIQAAVKKIDFVCHLDRNVPDTVMCDSVRVRQVVLNLMTNALKFTSAGKIEFSLILADIKNGNAELKFAVQDTGIGIAADKIDIIFEKFSQADLSINRRFGGTGLGLSICKLLVEKMGGEIKVTSKEGAGSKFEFSLSFPVKDEIIPSVIVPGVFKWKKIPTALVVEDNLINQKIVSFFLKELGCNVLIAQEGEEALAVLKINHADIIFMDQCMPGMSGLEVTKIIRGEMKITSVPIIAFTANNLKEAIAECLSSGMNDYLIKPLDRNKINCIIAKYLRSFIFSSEHEADIAPASDEGKRTASMTFNYLQLKQRLSDNEDLMNELLESFVLKAPAVFSELQKAVQSKNIKAVYVTAHTIKGMASHMSAERIADMSFFIEKMAHDENPAALDKKNLDELGLCIGTFISEYRKGAFKDKKDA